MFHLWKKKGIAKESFYLFSVFYFIFILAQSQWKENTDIKSKKNFLLFFFLSFLSFFLSFSQQLKWFLIFDEFWFLFVFQSFEQFFFHFLSNSSLIFMFYVLYFPADNEKDTRKFYLFVCCKTKLLFIWWDFLWKIVSVLYCKWTEKWTEGFFCVNLEANGMFLEFKFWVLF